MAECSPMCSLEQKLARACLHRTPNVIWLVKKIIIGSGTLSSLHSGPSGTLSSLHSGPTTQYSKVVVKPTLSLLQTQKCRMQSLPKSCNIHTHHTPKVIIRTKSSMIIKPAQYTTKYYIRSHGANKVLFGQ